MLMSTKTLLEFLHVAINVVEKNKDIGTDAQIEDLLRRIQLRWLYQRPRITCNRN